MEPFKNLLNLDAAKKIAFAILRSYPSFDSKSFLKGIDLVLLPLELKERVGLLSERLHLYLPNDPQKSIPILIKALKQKNDDQVGIEKFTVWPLTHFVSAYGLDHFDLSMNALKEMTKCFTSEFAVRDFFLKDEKSTLKYFNEWVTDENEHVRRLVSEGSRPLLPWAKKLPSFVEHPERTWSFLEKLKNDPSEYVRKSVANHINDHSKNHPDYVIDKLLVWYKLKNKKAELTWVIKHSSRTLIKKGYKNSFILHGVESSQLKVIEQKIITKNILIGEKLIVKVSIENLSKHLAKIIIDHELHFLKANKKHGLKVFKGKVISLAAKEVVLLEMSIPIKNVTTRVYYEGEQFWNIKINGVSQKIQSFTLKLKKKN